MSQTQGYGYPLKQAEMAIFAKLHTTSGDKSTYFIWGKRIAELFVNTVDARPVWTSALDQSTLYHRGVGLSICGCMSVVSRVPACNAACAEVIDTR